MSSADQVEIETEYKRIGIRTGDRLPMPRDLKDEFDYLNLLRQVPDGSGVKGFTSAMAQRAKHA